LRLPLRMLSDKCATTPWARLRCFLGGADGSGVEFITVSLDEYVETNAGFPFSAFRLYLAIRCRITDD
jgi:hypothetical protein